MAAMAESRKSYKNRILASLAKTEIARLSPYLAPLTLTADKELIRPGGEMVYGCFLESGMASVIEMFPRKGF